MEEITSHPAWKKVLKASQLPWQQLRRGNSAPFVLWRVKRQDVLAEAVSRLGVDRIRGWLLVLFTRGQDPSSEFCLFYYARSNLLGWACMQAPFPGHWLLKGGFKLPRTPFGEWLYPSNVYARSSGFVRTGLMAAFRAKHRKRAKRNHAQVHAALRRRMQGGGDGHSELGEKWDGEVCKQAGFSLDFDHTNFRASRQQLVGGYKLDLW